MSRLSDRGSWWRGIAPGDSVTYVTPQGNTRSGKVVISTATHVVLNAGGKHGTPAVVDEHNYSSHRATSNRAAKR
jgi:hypothetical protein